MVLLLVILNLKGQSPQDQKNMLYQKLQLGQSGLTVLWYAGRSSKQQRLLVLLFCHPKPEKEQSPRDQKTVLYQTSQLGESGFDSFLVCWPSFEQWCCFLSS